MKRANLVLGLTGSFGSGCSTLAQALESNNSFVRLSLSRPVRDKWAELNPAEAEAGTQPTRSELQDIGNQLRQQHGAEFLSHLIAQRIEEHLDKDSDAKFVVDGVKNEDEVAYLRRTFPEFFLIAVLADHDSRWDRVKSVYSSKQADFDKDDERDQGEDGKSGQQVQLCVDDADIAIKNDQDRNSAPAARQALSNIIDPYLRLIAATDMRAPSRDEVSMTSAYIQARRSLCIKRIVGAVITDENGKVLSTGYNENPQPLKPCFEEFGYCFKDNEMISHLERSLHGTRCPRCGLKLPKLEQPFRCPECGISLKAEYFSDRGMRWCTAIHAEERAIASAGGRNLQGSVLYSTTFPCFNCSRQIVEAGIKHVIYVEPYPNKDGIAPLRRAGLRVELFEGVKARAFERIFRPFQKRLEDQYSLA